MFSKNYHQLYFHDWMFAAKLSTWPSPFVCLIEGQCLSPCKRSTSQRIDIVRSFFFTSVYLFFFSLGWHQRRWWWKDSWLLWRFHIISIFSSWRLRPYIVLISSLVVPRIEYLCWQYHKWCWKVISQTRNQSEKKNLLMFGYLFRFWEVGRVGPGRGLFGILAFCNVNEHVTKFRTNELKRNRSDFPL